MSADDQPDTVANRRLGYLFKHAQARMEALNTRALAPFGIDSRELGILLVIADLQASSQQEVAERMGIDRTTMVARVDALEAKGLVSRHPHADDRRRNVVELTARGRDVTRRAARASERAEAELLAPLTAQQAQRLRDALQAVVRA